MRKLFAFVFFISCFLGHTSAHAGIKARINACYLALVADRPKPVLHIAEAIVDYENFLKLRTANPQSIPPAAVVTEETTVHEKYFGFLYWWLPGNIWHNTLRPHFSGVHMYIEYRRNGGQKLKLEDMPEPHVQDASLNVPRALPSPPPGKLDYAFQRRAELQLEAYLAQRKKDPAAIPDVAQANEATTPEEIYYGFKFWWFPGNIYHHRISVDHDELSETIFESHILEGYKFPAPPVFAKGGVMDVPPTYIEHDATPPAAVLGNSPESASLDQAATSIDGSDSTNANTAAGGPAGTP